MCGIGVTIGYKHSDVDTIPEEISHRGRDNRGIREFTYKDKTIHLDTIVYQSMMYLH